jgi:acetylornithine deacetylase/succinyl-diaminopimelate desuccinylase-like protein
MTGAIQSNFQMSTPSIEAYLHANRDRFVRELCEYLRFPSVSAQPQHHSDINACAKWLVQQCQQIGLKAKLCATPGNPVVLARTPRTGGKRRPTYLVYGHYDVQPPDPLQLWTSPPFEPRIKGSSLFARGSSDNKGQHWAHLKAVEAYLKTGTELPCDLIFLVEGEEEVGSSNLAGFLKRNRSELACDGIVISDTGLISPKHPTLTYALRGIAAAEIKVYGPARDLHSGLFGGSVDNPALVLCQMLAALRNGRGQVTVPGFYDDARALSKFERAQLRRQPFDKRAYAKFLGVPELNGERGFTPIEQRSARPTLEINGLTSGYQGEGSKTIIPSWAIAKITMRLVPDQTPEKMTRLLFHHLKKICPPTVRLELEGGHGGEPYLISPEGSQVQAGLRALRRAFGYDPILVREGGSIPILIDFKKILRADALLLGLSLPDDNPHSPNEKFDLDVFAKGMRMGAYLWQELGVGPS